MELRTHDWCCTLAALCDCSIMYIQHLKHTPRHTNNPWLNTHCDVPRPSPSPPANMARSEVHDSRLPRDMLCDTYNATKKEPSDNGSTTIEQLRGSLGSINGIMWMQECISWSIGGTCCGFALYHMAWHDADILIDRTLQKSLPLLVSQMTCDM